MTTIYEDLDLPSGDSPYPAEVRIRLAGAQGRPILGRAVSTNKAIVGETVLRTGAAGGISSSGLWTLDVVPNADIAPPGTTYLVSRKVGCDLFETYITVPVTGGPYEAFTLEDDPMGTITPSALGAHASDATLHGGGVEYDSATITTAVTVTGTSSGFVAAVIPGSTITVPQLARPVRLRAHLPAIQPSGGPSEQSWGIFRSGSMGALQALDVNAPGGLNTTTARTVELTARLDPLSGGDFVIGATGLTSNYTARLGASAIAKLFFWVEGA